MLNLVKNLDFGKNWQIPISQGTLDAPLRAQMKILVCSFSPILLRVYVGVLIKNQVSQSPEYCVIWCWIWPKSSILAKIRKNCEVLGCINTNFFGYTHFLKLKKKYQWHEITPKTIPSAGMRAPTNLYAWTFPPTSKWTIFFHFYARCGAPSINFDK